MTNINRRPSTENSSFEMKHVFDFTVASILILAALPLFIVIPILIKVFSKGPVFFIQKRCGLNGEIFYLYKFRTMIHGAEKLRKNLNQLNESDGPVFKIEHDPRIIPFLGRFLRKTGIDELPQLFNVIKGDMSLVGPRPPIFDEVKRYTEWQRRRLAIKPGITCLWQCSNRRNDIPFNEWICLDIYYIESRSLMLDFKILLKTAIVVFTGQGR